MRHYTEENELLEVTCNKCGKTIKVESGIIKEGCVSTETLFGYFSKKDGVRHKFDLCEECYDKIIADFTMPVEASEENELL